MHLYAALLQIPGVDAPALTWQEQISTNWENTGFMRWPLALCLALGIIVIIVKFISLTAKASKTRTVLREVDELLTQRRIREALEFTRDSDTPAAKILYAGLERHEEGSERVMKAIENQGLIEMSKLEKGLVVLATLTNVAPLLGFLGTVSGMIGSFTVISESGMDPQKMAGGISEALITTAAGLVIAIPCQIAYNYFTNSVQRFVLDIEESAAHFIEVLSGDFEMIEKQVDTLHEAAHEEHDEETAEEESEEEEALAST